MNREKRFSVAKVVSNALLIVLILAALVLSLAQASPIPQEGTSVPAGTPVPQGSATPAVNIEAIRSQTNGIIIGAVLLTVIVIGGSLVTIRRRSDRL